MEGLSHDIWRLIFLELDLKDLRSAMCVKFYNPMIDDEKFWWLIAMRHYPAFRSRWRDCSTWKGDYKRLLTDPLSGCYKIHTEPTEPTVEGLKYLQEVSIIYLTPQPDISDSQKNFLRWLFLEASHRIARVKCYDQCFSPPEHYKCIGPDVYLFFGLTDVKFCGKETRRRINKARKSNNLFCRSCARNDRLFKSILVNLMRIYPAKGEKKCDRCPMKAAFKGLCLFHACDGSRLLRCLLAKESIRCMQNMETRV